MSSDTAPEKNITDEIVDGLAKNYTDLEKKYSELEKRQAKTEGLDATISGLIPKVKTLEINAAAYPKVYVPDYSKDFKNLFDQLKILKEAYDRALRQIEEKINAIPKVLPVKNLHHFEPKAKPVFNLFIALIISIAVLSGICVTLEFEVSRLKDESNRFLILRGFYPEVAGYIDKAYSKDADGLIKKAEANIQEQQMMSAAAFAAKQAAEEKVAGEGKNKRAGNKSARSRKAQTH